MLFYRSPERARTLESRDRGVQSLALPLTRWVMLDNNLILPTLAPLHLSYLPCRATGDSATESCRAHSAGTIMDQTPGTQQAPRQMPPVNSANASYRLL